MDFLDFDYSFGTIMSQEERDIIESLQKHLPTTPILQQQVVEERNEVNVDDESFWSSIMSQENKETPRPESVPKIPEEQVEAKRIFEDMPPVAYPDLSSVSKPVRPDVKHDMVPSGKENTLPQTKMSKDNESRKPLPSSSHVVVPKITIKHLTPTLEPHKPLSAAALRATNPDANASNKQMVADRDFESDLKDLEEVIREDLVEGKRSAIPVDPVSYKRIKQFLLNETLKFINMTRGVKRSASFESSNNKRVKVSNPQDFHFRIPDSNRPTQVHHPVQRNPAMPRIGIRAHQGQFVSQPMPMQRSVSFPGQIPVAGIQNPIGVGPQTPNHEVLWSNSRFQRVGHQPQLHNLPYSHPNLHHQYQNPDYLYMTQPHLNYPNTVFSGENPTDEIQYDYGITYGNNCLN